MSLVKHCRGFCASVCKIWLVPMHGCHPVHNGDLLCQFLKCGKSAAFNSMLRQVHTSTFLDVSSKSKEDDPVLHITKTCVEQLQKIVGADEFLRLTVEGGGCSGFSYKFALDKSLNDDDICFEKDGVRIVSDNLSLELIKGSTVDYETELIKSAFIVKDNPQSSGKCSCGVSFSID